jgi:hypothetical protein
MSEHGTMPLYSQFVRGGTRLPGYQVGFAANVVATSNAVELYILFLEDRTSGPIPEHISFKIDSAGNASLATLTPQMRQAIEEQLSLLGSPCSPEA